MNTLHTVWTVIFIAVGGAMGAILRTWLSAKLNRPFPSSLPYGTLTVNLTGAFAMGLLIAWINEGSIYAALGIGVLGAWTTFSTLMLELHQLLIRREFHKLIAYLSITLIGGIILVTVGFMSVDVLFN